MEDVNPVYLEIRGLHVSESMSYEKLVQLIRRIAQEEAYEVIAQGKASGRF